MRILIVNKFLHPNGGSETYIFKLGDYLCEKGHDVQFFGMEHTERIAGNRVNAYVGNMDFHNGSKIRKLLYPIKTIYSSEARKKIRLVLDDFQPDVCHLNNFNYQLTPSILLEIRKWSKQTGRKCKILYTAHDPQLVCPNHMCLNPNTHEICEKCLGGYYFNCAKGKCIHGSFAKSLVGSMEAYFWKWVGVYKQLDVVVCPSHFIKSKLDTNPVLAKKTVVRRNFVDALEKRAVQKKDYVLYFGRYSQEKGIKTLIDAAKSLPEISFIFAGAGPLEHLLKDIPNIKNVGFQSGEALKALVCQARLTVCPSECYENCPFSVMESQLYGTPVLGANIGGIPELIREGETGELFESGNLEALKQGILKMWNAKYTINTESLPFDTIVQYCEKLEEIYKG